MGDKSHNSTSYSLLQPVVVYSFSEIYGSFPIKFLRLRDQLLIARMVSICLIRSDRNKSLHFSFNTEAAADVLKNRCS